MSDLIDRQAAIDGILAYMPLKPRRGASTAEQAVNQISHSIWRTAISCAESYVRTMPSAEPERKKGRWINHRKDRGHNIADCDRCGGTLQWLDPDERPNFCPDCGADMREGVQDE